MGTGNAINANSTGLVRYNGTGTFDAVTTTQHDILLGAASNGITNLAPSATTGAPLISAGAAADPAFSTTFTISDSGLIASETASLVGGVVQLGVRNTDNTNASSGARLNVTAGGSSAGDVYTLYDCNVAGKNYEVGCQQSSSNFLINYAANTGTALLSGTNIFYHDPTPSAVAQPATPSTFLQNTNYLALNQTAAGQRVRIECIQNDSANTASAAGIGSRVAGAIGSVNGDAFMYCVGNLDWTWGEDASSPGVPVFRFGHGGTPRALAETFYSIGSTGQFRFTPTAPAQVIVGTGTPTTEGAGDRIPFSVAQAVVAGTLGAEIFNTDNTNVGSRATLNVRVGGTSAGDATIGYIINSGSNWVTGSDNSDSDKWKLSQGLSLGVNDVIVATTAGAVTKPLQPAFTAFLSSAATNSTGDGTAFTIIFDSTNFNVGTMYNTGTGVATIPAAGKYLITAQCLLTSVGVGHTGCSFDVVSTAGTYGSSAIIHGSDLNPATCRDLSNNANDLLLTATGFINFAASDAFKVVVTVTGSTKTVGVFGNASPNFYTMFSAVLLC